jgi:hypothetical protein
MNIPIFNFQKMMNMHKGYAYQFFNSIAYKRNWTKNKESRFLEPNQTKICRGIEL